MPMWGGRAVLLTSPPVSKALIICEKPSVARDVAAALPGTFGKKGDFFEGPDAIVALRRRPPRGAGRPRRL